jgi:DNA-binding response OmpR family regulator
MNREKILIVEDERAVARGIEYALKTEGFIVLWADCGRDALQMAREQSPHLILLDIRLPDMTGFEVCRQLRGAGLRQPILMVTARDEEIDRVLGLEMGADDYIVKPFSLRELVARVRAACAGRTASCPTPPMSPGLPSVPSSSTLTRCRLSARARRLC